MTLTRQSATQFLSDPGTGRLSAVDLMRSTLDRINQATGPVNAIAALRERNDLTAGDHAVDAGPDRGPLRGLPITVRDLVNVAGFVPDRDDMIAAPMRAAGAILIGKTNTPEFGLGSHTFNPIYGATCNPYDVGCTCGGSSGAAAYYHAATNWPQNHPALYPLTSRRDRNE